jgi:hypothetical protein
VIHAERPSYDAAVSSTTSRRSARRNSPASPGPGSAPRCSHNLPFGVVTPRPAIHPAIIAQAIRTLGAMYPAGSGPLGTGEASNEHHR